MLNHRQFVFILVSLFGLLGVACTSADSDSVQTVESSPQPVATEQTADLSTGSEAEPAAITRPRSTVTPTPELEGTSINESESVTFYLQAFNSIGRGDYIDAERTFTTVIELEPGFARGWDGRGQALMLQGKYEEALLDFEKAIELKPNLAVAYENKSLTRIAIDDPDGAARDARRAYELDQDSVSAQLVLGRVHARDGENEVAIEWFNKAVATGPEDASTWWWRGRFYRDVLGLGNAALDDFNTAIELAPAQAALYLDRATLYIQANIEPALARADLYEAISLSQDPKLPNIIQRAEDLIAKLDEKAAAAQ